MAQKQTGPDGEESRRQGQMTVEEAGRMGGHKGGQRVRELVEEGKRAEQKDAGGRETKKDRDDET